MKLFRLLSRSIRDASKSIVRNISLSLASILSITITLILLGSFLIASYNIDKFTKDIKEDVSVIVFINSSLSDTQINELKTQILKDDNITNLIYESKEEVKEKLAQESDTLKAIMETWQKNENPLYGTFEFKVKKLEKITETVNTIKEFKGVSMVEYGESFVTSLLEIVTTIQNIVIATLVALVVVTAFLIANTIKLTITARKNEISIMRLVGASNTAIKLPFIFEGLFLGIIGSIIPIIICVYGYIVMYNNLGGTLFTPIIKLIKPEPFVYTISLMLLLTGIFVGMWGSARAVRKHLRI